MKGFWTPTRRRRCGTPSPVAKSLDDSLRAVNGVPEDKILRSLAAYFDMPFIDLEKDGANYAPSKEFLAKFPARILLDRHLMPLAENGDGVAIVTSRIFDNSGLDELRLATGLDVHPVIAPSAEIDRFIKKYLGVGADTLQSMGMDDDDGVKVLEDEDEDDLDLSSAAARCLDHQVRQSGHGRSAGISGHRRASRAVRKSAPRALSRRRSSD